MTKLEELYAAHRQSPWLDNLRRDWLNGGQLAEFVRHGIRGVTSNPTIFARAIAGEKDYDEQFSSLSARSSIEDAYWELVIEDITQALELLRGVYERSAGTDGFVSLEVAPALAHDTEATVLSAVSLHERIDRPNLLVKVPATSEGVRAVRRLISEGRSINVTLIFGLPRYDEVMEAYLAGLEDYAAAGHGDLSAIASVASFFVSRVDTEVDHRLEALAGGQRKQDPEILELRGQAAVAQAQEAYQHFIATFSGPRWEALAKQGARVQRPLWASTSTKNPMYPDLLYVEPLIGPETVNTMPETTLQAFDDHGIVARTIDADPQRAAKLLERLESVGIDMSDVASSLEAAGVRSFAKSFDELLQTLSEKAAAFGRAGR